MEITLQVPDQLATLLPDREKLPREMLEAFAADAYRNEKLTRHQVGQLLGLDRWKTEEFLASRNAQRPYDLTDWEIDRATLESLK
jgi:DnaJ-domain-containing protein 1